MNPPRNERVFSYPKRGDNMLIPDCRQDEYYNYDFLSDAEKEHIDGFDLCVEVIRNALRNAEDMDFERLPADYRMQ